MGILIIPRFREKPKRRPAHNKKTVEEYKKELSEKNPNLELVGIYVDSRTSTYHRCKTHNYYWKISPDNALHGQGCKYCKADKTRRRDVWSNSYYLDQLHKKNPLIVPLEGYINSSFPIWHWFLDCGHIVKSSPTSILKNGKCLKCVDIERGASFRKSHKAYVQELHKINPYIDVISKYTTANNKVLCKCKICGNEWSAIANSLLRGTGCPKCAFSAGEKKIRQYLDCNNIEFISQYSIVGLIGVGGGLLSYDFYIPYYNIFIEFQGKQHECAISGYFGGEEQFAIQQEHDRRKREYAKQHGFTLLEIWYYDYDRIEEILKENLNLESVETVIEA